MKICAVTAIAIGMTLPATAYAKEKPLPADIKIVTDVEVKGCKFVDIVTGSKAFMFKRADDANRDAIIEALDKAKIKGADSAVLSGTTSANKEISVTLTAYRCSGA